VATNLDKFRGLLQELFQLDQADLDFGIYRIMNQKRDEVVRFLDRDLLPQVQAAFAHYQSADKSVLQSDLAKLEKSIRDADMNPDESSKVKELRAKIAGSAVDVTALENEVFSHLFNFFRRYYSEGDFISQRRYKAGVYAIPYEGEEVKLHWANADQYYIKSSETFRDYTFTIASGKRVRVHLVAATTEQDNNKPAAGKERRFVLCKEQSITEENGELYIRFEYREAEGKAKQDDLNAEAVSALLKATGFEEWTRELGRAAPTPTNKTRTVLEKHLTQYTARNTFDYFIHKDLGGFLRRELDFFIKNEVMHLDDVEQESAPKVEQYLSQIRVIRAIAHKIIAFLEQLENFQKRLWLKKKFVIETGYCITLDRVPETLYPEIAANDAQREEWVKLFAINEIKADVTSPAYSVPLKVEFLKANSSLVLDTKYFPIPFRDKLLASIADLDLQTDGILFYSENFQALQMMQKRFSASIEMVYTDPPYNTSENTFIYKNNYRHSSWAAMWYDRVALARQLLRSSGVFTAAIDDTELATVRNICDQLFGQANYICTTAIEVNPAGQNIRPSVPARSHDYAVTYGLVAADVKLRPRELTDVEKAAYKEADKDGAFLWDNLRRRGGNSRPIDRPNQWFPLYVDAATRRVSVDPFTGGVETWPIDPVGERRIWRVNREGARAGIADGSIGLVDKAGRTEVSKKSRMPKGKKPKTLWKDKKHSGTTHGTKLLKAMFRIPPFSYPKSIYLVEDCLRYWLSRRGTVADFFAGSGTTAHAIIQLNRGDKGKRKYILAESGLHLRSAIIPRIKKAVYSAKWKAGKPVKRDGTCSAT
jgi:adenine-specific DNA-methyltransferase